MMSKYNNDLFQNDASSLVERDALGKSQGFTLIEVMVAMMITLIGMLALGSLTITSMDSNELASERTEAVNLGTRIMEEWIASPTDALPTPSCTPAVGQLVSGGHLTCNPVISTVNVQYDIYPVVSNTNAPIPDGIGNPASGVLGAGLRVTSILVDSTNSNILYVGTDGGGLYTSSNAGTAWTRVGNIGYIRVNDIKQDSNGSIYAGTDVGVITNQGPMGTWILRNAGLQDLTVHALLITSLIPPTLYAGTNSGVFKSTNSGTNWAASSGNPPTNITNLKVNALAIDPATPTTLYAGTDVNRVVGPSSGVFKSVDGGVSWISMMALTANNVNALAVDPTITPTILYAGTDVYTATVGTSNGLDVYAGVMNPNGWDSMASSDDSFTLALAMNGATAISGTRGSNAMGQRGLRAGVYDGVNFKTWFNTVSNQAMRRVYSIAIDPRDSTRWYAGTDAGVLKSTNSGATWTAINNGIGIVPKEKVVTISWNHKGANHSIVLTHISRRPY